MTAADPVPSAPLRQRAAELLRDICDGHARHRDFKPDCGPCIARLEAFAQAVREEATRAERARLDVDAMRANLHATFNGGHHDDPAALRAFHHGMDTVCNVLEAWRNNKGTNGILPAADPGEGTP